MLKARTNSFDKPLARGGQSILEYAVLLGVVTVTLLGMQVYAKRGIQATVRTAADQLGDQADGIRYESGERQNRVIPEGRTLERQARTAVTIASKSQMNEEASGKQVREIDDTNTAAGILGADGLASSASVIADVR